MEVFSSGICLMDPSSSGTRSERPQRGQSTTAPAREREMPSNCWQYWQRNLIGMMSARESWRYRVSVPSLNSVCATLLQNRDQSVRFRPDTNFLSDHSASADSIQCCSRPHGLTESGFNVARGYGCSFCGVSVHLGQGIRWRTMAASSCYQLSPRVCFVEFQIVGE